MSQRDRRPSFFHSLFGQSSPPKNTKFTQQNLSSLYQQLNRIVDVNDRNKDSVVESLRTIAEIIIWGDKHEPSIFEYFLEKNMLSIFWRFLEQERTPSSVKQQLLQTLSLLIQNIEAGPSVYFILSNNHINELIAHSFDLDNEEILAHYVSLLKAIALRLDKDTVQFFIGETPEPVVAGGPSSSGGAATRTVTRFPLYDEAIKLWANDEPMVRTAVRTIVLSICRVEDAAVCAFVSRSPMLPRQLSVSLRADFASLTKAVHVAAGASQPSGSQMGAMEGALQLMLDDLYFVNDVLEAGVEPLCSRILSALLSQFVMPLAVQPLVGSHALSDGGGSSSSNAAAEERKRETLPKLVALLVLAHGLNVFSYPALLSSMTTILLHPRLRLADVKLSKLDSLPFAALDLARASIEGQLRSSAAPQVEADAQSAAGKGAAGGGTGGSGGGVGGTPSRDSAPPHARASAAGMPPVEMQASLGSVVMPISEGGPECNALRAAMLAMLRSADERLVLLASCTLLAAVRCTVHPTSGGAPSAPPGHDELLRQAELLPLRHLRSESLLAQLLRNKAPASPANSPARPADAEGGYCQTAVEAVLEVLLRAASQHSVPDEVPPIARAPAAARAPPLPTPMPAPLPPGASADEATRRTAATAATATSPHATSTVRLVTVQTIVELLLELTHDSSPTPNLTARHALMLEAAHAAAAASLQRALNGRFAASLGNLLECARAPPITRALRCLRSCAPSDISDASDACDASAAVPSATPMGGSSPPPN